MRSGSIDLNEFIAFLYGSDGAKASLEKASSDTEFWLFVAIIFSCVQLCVVDGLRSTTVCECFAHLCKPVLVSVAGPVRPFLIRLFRPNVLAWKYAIAGVTICVVRIQLKRCNILNT